MATSSPSRARQKMWYCSYLDIIHSSDHYSRLHSAVLKPPYSITVMTRHPTGRVGRSTASTARPRSGEPLTSRARAPVTLYPWTNLTIS